MKSKALKSVLLTAAAIMLVVATVFATMAYMTSSAAVSNVFTVGDVKLHMYETKVNSDGIPEATIPEGEMKNTDTNSYHLLPGTSYLKDPTVYVDATSDESYLFVRVRNDLKTIEMQDNDEHPTINEQLQANGWLEIYRADTNVDAVYVYVGKENAAKVQQLIATVESDADYTAAERTNMILAAAKETEATEEALLAKVVGGSGKREDYDVFQEFTLAKQIDNLAVFGGARVAIVAYAIQTSGLTESYENADGEKVEEVDGCQSVYLRAWEYIKNELPFVV